MNIIIADELHLFNEMYIINRNITNLINAIVLFVNGEGFCECNLSVSMQINFINANEHYQCKMYEMYVFYTS